MLQPDDLSDVGKEDVNAKFDTRTNKGKGFGGIRVWGIAVEIGFGFCYKDRDIEQCREEKTLRIEEGGVWMSRLSEEKTDGGSE